MQLAHSLVNNLRRIRTSYRVNSKIKDTLWAKAIIDHGIDPDGVSYEREKRSVCLRDIGLSLDRAEHTFILKGLEFARSLFENGGARFENSEGLINVLISGLSVEVRTFEELFILHEVFVEGSYNLKLSKPAIAIDIGMNVGFSSLSFAQNPKVYRVYGFEPAKLTYEHALRNFSLNSDLAKKIVPFDFGLSDKDETVEFDFSEEIKGSVGIEGLSHRSDIDQSKVKKLRLNLKSASREIEAIFDENPNIDFVLKIDCEGSEYKIVEALSKESVLERASIIMLEWHDPTRQQELESHLLGCGFTMISLTPNSKVTGMMYAARI